MYKLRLISTSPRRHELLTTAGYNFSVCPLKLSEQLNKKLSIEAGIMDLARQKVQFHVDSVNPLKKHRILALGADTMVCLGDKIFPKPMNVATASKTLATLAGKTHKVITGVSIYEFSRQEYFSFFDTTLVTFRALPTQEIYDYVNTGEPLDKAGAYAIQGKGKKLVECITGSWSNVVGLPMEKLEAFFAQEGFCMEKTQCE